MTQAGPDEVEGGFRGSGWAAVVCEGFFIFLFSAGIRDMRSEKRRGEQALFRFLSQSLCWLSNEIELSSAQPVEIFLRRHLRRLSGGDRTLGPASRRFGRR